MRAEIDLNSRKTSITIPRSKPRHQKPSTTPKPLPYSTTQPPVSEAAKVQAPTASSGNLSPPLAEKKKPSPLDTLNSVINAHYSEVKSEEN